MTIDASDISSYFYGSPWPSIWTGFLWGLIGEWGHNYYRLWDFIQEDVDTNWATAAMFRGMTWGMSTLYFVLWLMWLIGYAKTSDRRF